MNRRQLTLLPPLPLLLLCFPLLFLSCRSEDTIVVGSKNFTESILLGEIVAQQLERHGLRVDRRLNLGGSFICHNAMVSGQLDVYVEYTGTAYSAILELPREREPAVVMAAVDSVYEERWGIVWAEPLGFNNTFAMLIRGDDARRLGINSITEALPHTNSWRFGAGYEFIERADGYRGFLKHYGVEFAGTPTELDLGLTYRALAENRVDIIAGNSTDGQIEALDLFHLVDDRGYFPPYEAVPVVRTETLDRLPGVREALAGLAGKLSESNMRHLNYLVDVEKASVKDVAADFLSTLDHGS
jgi:glycine betaine/choline ABC-type transport system substrate-binding protein